MMPPFLRRLFRQRPQAHASALAKHGAKLRKDRQRALFIATTNDLRARLGMEPYRWGRG